MDIADKERLIKLIGMLGSSHDGERANAAAFIQKLADKHKITITELMAKAHGGSGSARVIYKDRIVEKTVYKDRPAPPPPPPPPEPEPQFTDIDSPLLGMLRRVAAKPALAARILTSWEVNFVTDVAQRYELDQQFSEKQLVIIERILNKAARVFPTS